MIPIGCQDCHRSRTVKCKGNEYPIDYCIADLVEAINAHPNLRTTSTCCGHGVGKASFLCADNNDDYLFIEVDLHTPLVTWDKYRPIHEAMLRGKYDRD